MVGGSKTRFAQCGEIEIAYDTLGDGPPDILLFTGGTVPIECMDEDPALARFHRRLASFGRLLRFDRRGTGLSHRMSPSAFPTREEWAQDGLAVLDAVGGEKAVVVGPGMSAPETIVLAATQPERVSSLILLNGAARLTRAEDYPHGVPQEIADLVSAAVEPDAMDRGFDLLSNVAPSVAQDEAFRAWFDRAGNLGVTPAMARAGAVELFEMDVRRFVPSIRVPTLIVHRARIQLTFVVEHGRYLAESIKGAKYVELQGCDVLYWVGDAKEMLDEIEEFLTGARSGSDTERVLATVLFTDIVGSTDRALELGDRGWRDLLDRHDQAVRSQIHRFRGREVNTTGDGFVATFDTPGGGVECAIAIRDALRPFSIEMRAGIHTGEIEVRGRDIAGLAVHVAARVSALASPGEILVSSTVNDLLGGWNIEFEDRGERELKGLPGTKRLFAVNTVNT